MKLYFKHDALSKKGRRYTPCACTVQYSSMYVEAGMRQAPVLDTALEMKRHLTVRETISGTYVTFSSVLSGMFEQPLDAMNALVLLNGT